MKVSYTVYKKALSILDNKQKLDTCLRAGICPVCGSELKIYKSSYWSHAMKITTELNIIECSRDPEHYRDSKEDNTIL